MTRRRNACASARLEDRGVEAAFGDDVHLLIAARGVHNVHPLLILVEEADHFLLPVVAEGAGDIVRDEPRVARDPHHADGFFELVRDKGVNGRSLQKRPAPADQCWWPDVP